jgi:hypothetical protein
MNIGRLRIGEICQAVRELRMYSVSINKLFTFSFKRFLRGPSPLCVEQANIAGNTDQLFSFKVEGANWRQVDKKNNNQFLLKIVVKMS